MAKEDDDWKKFMDSIDEPDEEVETDDESEDENLEDESEKPEKKSKKSKDAAEGDEADEEDESEEDESDEADDTEEKGKDDKSKSTTYKPRIKQFLNEDGTFDPKRAETAYIESSKEAVRLNTVLEETNEKYNRLVDAIKANPEAAKLLMGEKGAKNLAKDNTESEKLTPIEAHVKAQMTKQSKKDYNEFVEAHPELVTDPEIARKVGVFLKRFGRDFAEDNDGELPTMKEGLQAAYRYYGLELGVTKKEEVAAAAKKTAATRHTSNRKTPAPKQKKNELEGFFATKLGVKLK